MTEAACRALSADYAVRTQSAASLPAAADDVVAVAKVIVMRMESRDEL